MTYINTTYKFVGTNNHGQEIADFQNASSRSFTLGLNEAGSFSFSLPLTDSKATPNNLAPGLTGTRIYRNNKVVFVGDIYTWKVNTSDEGAGTIDIAGNGYLRRLDRRIIDGTFTNAYSKDIIITLMDTANRQFNLGLTYGTLDNTYQRSPALVDKHLLDVVRELAEADGADFFVDNNFKFSYVTRQGRDLPNFILEYKVNIIEPTMEVDATELVNKVKIFGSTTDPSPQVTVTKQNDSSIYKYGIFNGSASYTDYDDSNGYLTAQANRILSEQATVPEIYSFIIIPGMVPSFAEFGIGDRVMLRINWGNLFKVNKLVRVTGIDVKIDDGGKELVTITTDKKPSNVATSQLDIIRRLTKVEEKQTK